MTRVDRRSLLHAMGALPFAHLAPDVLEPTSIFSVDFATDETIPFDPTPFGICGIYDADWFFAPEFERMLDLMAESGGFHGVRTFGLFTMGARELLAPESGGTVWPDRNQAPDFSLPFAALDALVSRGLTPFIALSFFPGAVSSSPILPPDDFADWQSLLRSFFGQLVEDPRFGAEAVSEWWFEVWNEPNEGRFWSGSFAHYLDLYQATSDVVTSLGLNIRLGGPAMAYKPESSSDDGPETMRFFLEFLARDPQVKCDFISYHRKGTVDQSPPDPARLRGAATEIEALAKDIVPARCGRLVFFNNEADEKIGFETPFEPRMTHFAASWLTILLADHLALSVDRSHSFLAAQDNANLQLMQTPFDGRRSIFSFLDPDDRAELVKTSGAIWYDLLSLMHGEVIVPSCNDSSIEIHAIATRSCTTCCVLITWHPVGATDLQTRSVTLACEGIPWTSAGISTFAIDAKHADPYQTFLDTNGEKNAVRQAQQATAVKTSVACVGGKIELPVAITPYQTMLIQLTEG